MWSYSHNKTDESVDEVFKAPDSTFRGAPLWAWNSKLNKDMLRRQIECFRTMGMGGFHIHVRSGLQTEYLGDEYMDCVRMCVELAKQLGMFCWLYDEDRWPSGTAGGLVTKDRRYRARYIVFVSHELGDDFAMNREDFYKNEEKYKGYWLAKYEIRLQDGFLDEYKRLDDSLDNVDGANIWWVYLKMSEETAWYNHQTYVNTLDKEATLRFIDYTHEAYYKVVGAEFGKTIPAIFTDEPQFCEKGNLSFPEEKGDIVIPFTDDFDDTYFEEYKEHLLDSLPELIWQLSGNRFSRTRYRYHNHLCERFAQGYTDVIGKWCEEHDLIFTGHLMQEPFLSGQTKSVGETMRLYRSFQLPGVDMLCNGREFSTVKQAQSVSHQFGRAGVLCEMYGVTNWDFGFKDHKLMGDWLAALGVTTRVHHLAWLSMAGERKRDYPASIGYQSPWYAEYSYIEDYFARINSVLTRGKPQVRVGMIHPIESYWLFWGPNNQTAQKRQAIENAFQGITEWLLASFIDFDYIAESLLTSLVKFQDSDSLEIGEMVYDVIIIPECTTLRERTVDYLERYITRGGAVIFVGEVPRLIEGVEDDRLVKLTQKGKCIPISYETLIGALDEYRDIDILKVDGNRATNLLYQMRRDADKYWLFICHVNEVEKTDIMSQIFNIEWDGLEKIIIEIKGRYSVKIYDAISGEICSCAAKMREGKTVIQYEFYAQDSVLFLLETLGENEDNCEESRDKIVKYKRTEHLEEPLEILLSEPNVLLLDQAEYQLDGGDWCEKEEILRIDEKLRNQLGFSQRYYGKAQPWIERPNDETHRLRLRYTIESRIEIERLMLALEKSDVTRITLNEKQVDLCKREGWYVDESIDEYEIFGLKVGKNVLLVEMQYREDSDLESMYLLGKFGVEVCGRDAVIKEFNSNLRFGNWVSQGFPFYSANVTYNCKYVSDGAGVILRVAEWRGAVISVSIDGVRRGIIATEPYTLNLGHLEKGGHIISITIYGNRFNTFGAVHNCVKGYKWFGPNSWRTSGSEWSYQYRLKEMGILSTPLIYVLDE